MFDADRAIRTVENVTPEQFRNEIFPAAEPVKLKGVVADWPAVQAAKQSPRAFLDYVGQFDNGRPIETIFGRSEIAGRFFYNDDITGFNFDRRPEQLRNALGQLVNLLETDNPPSIYIQSAPIPAHIPGFDQQNALPHVDASVPPRIWIGNRLTVQTHFDLSENIACLVAGKRRFTLFPPSQTPNLYVGPFELTLAGPPVSMVRLEDPDYERFPRFREAVAHSMYADLEPGDAIYIPYAWWHHVESLTPFNCLVNYWWNDAAGKGMGSAFDAMLHALLAIRELPDRQREMWRGMFEYYVFKSHGEPVEHLPADRRGALGPHDEDMKRRLWITLAQAIGRTASSITGMPPQGPGGPPRRS